MNTYRSDSDILFQSGLIIVPEHDLHRTTSGREEVTGNHLQLVPTPSQSPADPLNWSPLRKLTILGVLSFYAFAADFTSGSLAPALPVMAYQIIPPPSFARLTKLVSVNTLMFGLSNIFWVPLSNIFGRRPILLVAMLLFTLTSVWGGVATSFESLLAVRALQGVAGGPSYTLAPDAVGEIFFVHQRGRAMATYTVLLGAGPFVGGITGACIAGNLGYQYIFWVSTAMAGFAFVMELLFVPETLFDRSEYLQQDHNLYSKVGEEKANVSTTEQSSVSDLPARFTYLQSLGFGKYRGGWIRHFAAPWLSLRLPGNWMVMLQYGANVGGVVTLSTVAPMFLAAPPYLWGNNVGLFSLGGLVGVCIAGLVTFSLADLLLKRQAKKETHGFSEPETRLPMIIPGSILGTLGLWTFGFCAANPSPNAWAGLVVGSGMQAFGLVIVPSIGFNYVRAVLREGLR